MPIKGNKWEWSELYVLMTLLAEWELYQSNVDLNKDEKNVYQVVKAYKNESSHELEFSIDKEADFVKLTKIDQNWNILRQDEFPVGIFKEISRKLLNWINNSKGKSFGIESIDEFLNTLDIQKIKTDSTFKSDIKIRVYDHRLAKEADLWFSIKSMLGSDSTLFNTWAGNNFIFRVIWWDNINLQDFNSNTYKAPGRISKLTYRINELKKMGCEFEFKEIQSLQLMKNLRMIDWDLPKILSYWLYYRWMDNKANLKDVCSILEERDPLNFYGWTNDEQRIYEYKIKKFLAECAMWMTSEKPWMWEYDGFWGVIIVKTDWDIVCFHIYDFNLFRKYLINNTKFEQASTGEDEENPWNKKNDSWKNYYYGWPYKERNEIFFKINLQIRFK